MLDFGLKKTQVWVTMALLLLCCSICPHSGYPYSDENEGPMGPRDHLDNDEDHAELDQDEDEEALEEEETFLKEAGDVEHGPLPEKSKCQTFGKTCGTRDKCCRKIGEELMCDSNYRCMCIRQQHKAAISYCERYS